MVSSGTITPKCVAPRGSNLVCRDLAEVAEDVRRLVELVVGHVRPHVPARGVAIGAESFGDLRPRQLTIRKLLDELPEGETAFGSEGRKMIAGLTGNVNRR
ncbi:hypothetical protein ABZ557_13210 [Streptomyces sp. NPDC019645]|uniref:hypothetical protein n=1 Tax=Streptomyces sp. NPDC019645 TaxID=3154786 RepID=UPI0033C86EF2